MQSRRMCAHAFHYLDFKDEERQDASLEDENIETVERVAEYLQKVWLLCEPIFFRIRLHKFKSAFMCSGNNVFRWILWNMKKTDIFV